MWYNSEGNYFRIKEEDDKVLMRVYRQATDENGNEWVEKLTYELEPELMRTEERDGKLNIGYEGDLEDCNGAYADFERESDDEYESGVEAKPATLTELNCSVRHYERELEI